MYQPNISKSPLLATGIIERDYTSGLPDAPAPETVKPEIITENKIPAPKKSFKPNAKPKNVATQVDVNSQENNNAEQIPDPANQSDPVDQFAFQDENNHLDNEVIDAENVSVEIPDDVARETAKQFTLLLDMGVALMCEKKLIVDMNSIRTAVTKGEIHPVFEEKFEEVNKANREASHLSKDNQKVVQQAFTAIIKDQKIQALNPTNGALANLAMVGISHYATVTATIQSNERMIASALEQSQKASDVTPTKADKQTVTTETKTNTKKF